MPRGCQSRQPRGVICFHERYLIISAAQGLSVIRGRNTTLFLENSAEVKGIIVADNSRYFCYIVIRGFQQAHGVVDTDSEDVLHRGFHGDLFEISQEPAYAHAAGLGIFLDIDGLIIVLIEIATGVLHFLLNIGADRGLAFLPASLYQQEDLSQVHFQKLLKTCSAGLEFLNHFLEQISVGGGGAGIENLFIQWDIVMPQDVLYIAAGEVDPVDLRLVFAKVFVVLLLPGLEQNHVSCSDFLGLSVKIKVGFAGGYIQKLIVQPSSGTPGGQSFFCPQPIGATASHNQGFGLVFERQS